MKTFSELNTIAASIANGYEGTTVSDATVRSTLDFFAEVKYTCEALENFQYGAGNSIMNTRLMRDVAIAGLNYAGNNKLIKCRFYSVWSQINALVTD